MVPVGEWGIRKMSMCIMILKILQSLACWRLDSSDGK